MSIEYKGGKCEKCGYDRCPGALTFHHVNPNDKLFTIGDVAHRKNWEIIKKELDKCILLCANCHFELHYEEGKNTRQVRLDMVSKLGKSQNDILLEIVKAAGPSGIRRSDIFNIFPDVSRSKYNAISCAISFLNSRGLIEGSKPLNRTMRGFYWVAK